MPSIHLPSEATPIRTQLLAQLLPRTANTLHTDRLLNTYFEVTMMLYRDEVSNSHLGRLSSIHFASLEQEPSMGSDCLSCCLEWPYCSPHYVSNASYAEPVGAERRPSAVLAEGWTFEAHHLGWAIVSKPRKLHRANLCQYRLSRDVGRDVG